jgi:hypothetical protein
MANRVTITNWSDFESAISAQKEIGKERYHNYLESQKKVSTTFLNGVEQKKVSTLNGVELENNIKHLTDEQWEWIRLQLVNEKLHSVGSWNMNVTLINRDLFLIVREIKCRKPIGHYQKIHSFMMVEDNNLYNIHKVK